MAQSHTRKTIRKNPLDALGSKPISVSAPINLSDSATPGDSVEDLPVQKKSVEALFDQVLDPQTKSAKKPLFKPVMGKQVVNHDKHIDPQALAIVKTWSQWAALGGTVPAPVVDVALISAAQVKMIHQLCKHYRIPFEKKVTFTLVSSLVGGSAPTWLAQTMTRSSLKSVPLVGSVMSLTAQPAFAFATTYAIGRTFVEHFESKGTLLNFSADKMSAVFSRFFQAARTFFKKTSP